jgi:hypothetical protein
MARQPFLAFLNVARSANALGESKRAGASRPERFMG